ATALRAFGSVYSGPPKSAACWPVLTMTPSPLATRLSRSAASPVEASAGVSAASHSPSPNGRATSSAYPRQLAASRGRGRYQSGNSPRCAPRASGEPPISSLMTRAPLMRTSFVVWLAPHDGAGPIELLGENEARELVRQGPGG